MGERGCRKAGLDRAETGLGQGRPIIVVPVRSGYRARGLLLPTLRPPGHWDHLDQLEAIF